MFGIAQVKIDIIDQEGQGSVILYHGTEIINQIMTAYQNLLKNQKSAPSEEAQSKRLRKKWQIFCVQRQRMDNHIILKINRVLMPEQAKKTLFPKQGSALARPVGVLTCFV